MPPVGQSRRTDAAAHARIVRIHGLRVARGLISGTVVALLVCTSMLQVARSDVEPGAAPGGAASRVAERTALRIARREAEDARAEAHEASQRATAAESRARAAKDELLMLRNQVEEATKRADALEKQLNEVFGELGDANARARDQETAAGECREQLEELAWQVELCDAGGPDPRKAATADMPEAVRRLYERERARQRRIQHEDADSADNGPKEISMFCPQDMQISIADLNDDDRDNNECMVLNLNGPGVSSRLVLFCDGTHSDFDGAGAEDGDDFADL